MPCCNFQDFWKAKHFQRLTMWRINNVNPSAFENQRMDAKGTAKVDVLRRYLAWRRTTLIAALPIICYSAIVSTVNYTQLGT